MIKILADVHVKKSIQKSLEQKGITVLEVKDELYEEAEDQEILKYGREEGFVILTSDSDFEQLASQRQHSGIIFITSQYARKHSIVSEITRITDQITEEEIKNSKLYVP